MREDGDYVTTCIYTHLAWEVASGIHCTRKGPVGRVEGGGWRVEGEGWRVKGGG